MKNIKRWWYHSTASPRNWWYFIRSHTFNRYHIVDCRSPKNNYDWGWCDVDGLMFYACFNLLKRFVEEEEPFIHTDYDYCDEDRKLKQEIIDLYDWWCDGRQNEHLDYDEYKRCIYGSDNEHTLYQSGNHRWCLEKRDDEMFERLMKIRHSLWT